MEAGRAFHTLAVRKGNGEEKRELYMMTIDLMSLMNHSSRI